MGGVETNDILSCNLVAHICSGVLNIQRISLTSSNEQVYKLLNWFG